MSELSFDLFSRTKIAQNIVESTIRNDRNVLSIIDLGGLHGEIEKFFPTDKVTVLDVYEVNDKSNYVKGDATNLAYDDNTFDISTSFDVLEHIPRKLRHRFIEESIRVASKVAILTFPEDTGNGEVIKAEIELNDFYIHLTGEHHPWLKEHIENGIPTAGEVESILRKLKYKYIKLPSNDLDLWKSMQVINFAAGHSAEAFKLSNEFNAEYRKKIHLLEAGILSNYRSVYVVIKDGALMQDLQHLADGETKKQAHASASSIHEFSSKVRQETTKLLGSYIRDYNAEIRERDFISRKMHVIESQLSYVTNSKSWRLTSPLRKLIRLFQSFRVN